MKIIKSNLMEIELLSILKKKEYNLMFNNFKFYTLDYKEYLKKNKHYIWKK